MSIVQTGEYAVTGEGMYAMESATMDEEAAAEGGFYIYPIKSNGTSNSIFSCNGSF